MVTPTREAIAGLPAYALAVQDVPGVERVIQLGQNELGVAPSPRAVEAALGDRDHLDRVVRDVTRLREAFRRHVRALGLEAARSYGNFVLVRFPDDGPLDAGDAFEGLKRVGIIVRPTGGYGLADCLRVTIGSAEEMALVSNELDRIVANARYSSRSESALSS